MDSIHVLLGYGVSQMSSLGFVSGVPQTDCARIASIGTLWCCTAYKRLYTFPAWTIILLQGASSVVMSAT